MKTIIVTGCSSGIGAAVAAALAKRGHWVFATARDTTTSASFSPLFATTTA